MNACLEASFDLVGWPLRFLDGGGVAMYREDDSGLPTVELHRLVQR